MGKTRNPLSLITRLYADNCVILWENRSGVHWKLSYATALPIFVSATRDFPATIPLPPCPLTTLFGVAIQYDDTMPAGAIELYSGDTLVGIAQIDMENDHDRTPLQ